MLDLQQARSAWAGSRCRVQWKELEPDKGDYNQPLSAMVLECPAGTGSAGFKTMISIAKAPGWSRPAAVVIGTTTAPPTNPQDLADFVTKMTYGHQAGIPRCRRGLERAEPDPRVARRNAQRRRRT